MNSNIAIDSLREELIRQGEADPTGGGWSDPVIQCLRPGHRNLQETLEIIESASDTFTTPRQRTLARQALGIVGRSAVARSGLEDCGEVELLEAMARGL